MPSTVSISSYFHIFADANGAGLGHKNAVQKGVLHRDISNGNILITGSRDRGKRGVLIDFDNAVNLHNYNPTPDDPLTVSIEVILSAMVDANTIF